MIRTLDNKKPPVIIALGNFDGVHIGHRRVLTTAVETAKKLGVYSAVFSFSGNLRQTLSGKEDRVIYSAKQKRALIKGTGIDKLFFVRISKRFLSMQKDEFLAFLDQKFTVKGYVCGNDFRFGKNGEGNAKYLEEYAREHNKTLIVVDESKVDGKKVSTTLIKEFLAQGKVEKANELLYLDYHVMGRVTEGRSVGRKLGYPTANILPQEDKLPSLKNGVYTGYVKVGVKSFPAIINYGARPTFELSEVLIEAHLDGFNGDLYGKKVTVYFTGFIRNVQKFKSIGELAERLKQDLAVLRKENV